MKSDFIIALTQLAAERSLPMEIVLSAIEAALVSAYKKDSMSAGQNISVQLDPGSGDVNVYIVKTVVENVDDPLLEIALSDAKKIKDDAEFGDVVPTESLPHSAGRIAAQTAKQVVLQRLREAERELVMREYSDKEGEVFTVTIQKMEPKHVTVELGRADAILPPSEQAPFERYRIGQRLKVLLQSVNQSSKGPEIIVSRTDKILLKRLFEMEVPEIYNGSVEIKDIAREAGARSKVAVLAKQEGVDAVGSCVGLRGIRIQNIVNELHGEKIDVVQWQQDPAQYVARALSPATVVKVNIDAVERSALAIVPENQLSLAIGKEGQNARLAARLTGWKVDIISNVEAEKLETADSVAVGTDAAVAVSEKSVDSVEENLTTDASTDDIPDREKETLIAAEAVVDINEQTEAGSIDGEAATPEVEKTTDTDVAKETQGSDEVPKEAIMEEIPFEAVVSDIQDKPDRVAVGVGEPEKEKSTSIQDLPDEVWNTRSVSTQGQGAVRFREDIVELGGSESTGRGRKKGAARRTKQKRRH